MGVSRSREGALKRGECLELVTVCKRDLCVHISGASWVTQNGFYEIGVSRFKINFIKLFWTDHGSVT